jgi:glycosyltransferase involved in cell wall biosynthesis
MPCTKPPFFEEALASVLRQTFRDFELLVVNNGADPEIRRLATAGQDHPDFRYIEHTVRLPIIANWNTCLNQAVGEYFVLFSDDDVYEPRFLESLMVLAARHPHLDVVHGRLRIIDGAGALVRNHATAPEWESCISFMWHRLFYHRYNAAPEFLARTAALRAIGGFVDFPEAWNSDNATWYALARQEGIAYSSRAVCNFRSSGINLSARTDPFVKFEAEMMFVAWLERFLVGLPPADALEAELLEDLRGRLDTLAAESRGQLLRAAANGPLITATARVARRWLALRRSHQLSGRLLARALAEVGARALRRDARGPSA